MAEKKQYYWSNNQLFDSTQLTLNPLNRAVRLSDGVFESILVVDGRIPLLSLHFKRVCAAIAMLQFSQNEKGLDTNNGILPWTEEDLFGYIQAVLLQNQLSTARVRLQIYRDAEGLYLPDTNRCAVIISAAAITPLLNSAVNVGFSAYSIADSVLQNHKTTNSIIYTLSALENKKNSWSQGILLHTSGAVADATSANVFMLKNGEMFTPSLSYGGIAGVMRAYLLQTETIFEKKITSTELLQADEIFLTNAVQGVLCVTALDGKTFHTEHIKKLQEKIAKMLLGKMP